MAREKSKQNKLKRLQDQLKAHIMQGDYKVASDMFTGVCPGDTIYSDKDMSTRRSRKARLLLEISRLERSK